MACRCPPGQLGKQVVIEKTLGQRAGCAERQPGLHATCRHVDALPPRRCEADVSSSPVTNRFWKKLPMVTLNLHLYETQQEEKSKPISRCPIHYKEDLPFDIGELMEEIEKKTGFLPNVFKCCPTGRWNSEPSLLTTVPYVTRKQASSAKLTRNSSLW